MPYNPYQYLGAAGGGYSGPGMGQNWYYGQGGKSGGYGRLEGAGYRNPYAGGGWGQPTPYYQGGGYYSGGGRGQPYYQSQAGPGPRSGGPGINVSGRRGGGGFSPGGGIMGMPGPAQNMRQKQAAITAGVPHGMLTHGQKGILQTLPGQYMDQFKTMFLLKNLGYDPMQVGIPDMYSQYYGYGRMGEGSGGPQYQNNMNQMGLM